MALSLAARLTGWLESTVEIALKISLKLRKIGQVGSLGGGGQPKPWKGKFKARWPHVVAAVTLGLDIGTCLNAALHLPIDDGLALTKELNLGVEDDLCTKSMKAVVSQNTRHETD